MQKLLLKSAFIGGLIAFIWGIFSWMVFPWHQNCLNKFSSEYDVASTIRDNAPVAGMYVLPNTFSYNQETPQHEIERGMKMMENGPFMLAAVRPAGMGKMTAGPFILSLIIQIIGAFIVSWMLFHAKGLSKKHQIGFVTLFGLAVGVLGQLPDWNWWGFSGAYVIVNMIDLIIAWFLAGIGIVKVLHKN